MGALIAKFFRKICCSAGLHDAGPFPTQQRVAPYKLVYRCKHCDELFVSFK